MLRPKKKMTMKDIQRDPFLEFIAKTKMQLSDNKNLFIKISAGIVIIIILFSLFSRNQKTNTLESNILLGKAMLYVDSGDNDNAILTMQNILDEYGSSKAGINANYFLGKIYLDQNNAILAEPFFRSFIKKSSHPFLLSAAFKSLADIYRNNNNYDSAYDMLTQAAENAANLEEKAYYTLNSIEILIEMGQIKSASDKLDNILITWKNNYDIMQTARELEGWIYVGKPI